MELEADGDMEEGKSLGWHSLPPSQTKTTRKGVIGQIETVFFFLLNVVLIMVDLKHITAQQKVLCIKIYKLHSFSYRV